MRVGMLTISYGIRDDSTPKAFKANIPSSLYLSRDAGLQAVLRFHLFRQRKKTYTPKMKASCDTGRAACAAKALICLILL